MDLMISVTQGRNLPARHIGSSGGATSDSFVTVLLGAEEIGRTTVVNGSLNPVWGCNFTTKISDADLEKHLVFKVWDKESFEDGPMGEVRIGLHKKIPEKDKMWAVKDEKNENAGHLQIKIIIQKAGRKPSSTGFWECCR